MINACDDFAGADEHEREHDLRVGAAIRGERSAIVSFLLRAAKDRRKHAAALLADTQQGKAEADYYGGLGAELEWAAEKIQEGRHWR